MRALCYRHYGGPDQLEWIDLPTGPLGSGELRIRPLATSVNPIDWKIASGALKWLMPMRFPVLPGSDLVGEITEIGEGLSGYTLGDKILAKLRTTEGTVRDELIIRADRVVPLGNIGVKQAAGAPLAGMTALQCLRDSGGLKLEGSTQRVLILGASGGVGHYATQIACNSGATVAGVCSTKNIDLITSLGVAKVYDYTKTSDFSSEGPYDIILVAAGHYAWHTLKPLLSANGVVVEPTPTGAMLPTMAFTALFSKQKYRPFMLKDRLTDLRWIQFHLSQGKINTMMQRVFHFSELPEAWKLSQTGHVVGKIVLLNDES